MKKLLCVVWVWREKRNLLCRFFLVLRYKRALLDRTHSSTTTTTTASSSLRLSHCSSRFRWSSSSGRYYYTASCNNIMVPKLAPPATCARGHPLPPAARLLRRAPDSLLATTNACHSLPKKTSSVNFRMLAVRTTPRPAAPPCPTTTWGEGTSPACRKAAQRSEGEEKGRGPHRQEG